MLTVQEIETSALEPWEKNPRLNDHAVDAVAKSVETFGFNVPILCDENMKIIAGHTRWKAAKKLDMQYVPVIVLSGLQVGSIASLSGSGGKDAQDDAPRRRIHV